MYVLLSIRQSDLDAYTALLNGGSFKIYSGPRNTDLSLTGANTLLATCALNATACLATDAGGIAVGQAVTPDHSPAASGNAAFALACKSDGTVIGSLGIGLAGSAAGGTDPDLVVASVAVTAGIDGFYVTSWKLSFPLGV